MESDVFFLKYLEEIRREHQDSVQLFVRQGLDAQYLASLHWALTQFSGTAWMFRGVSCKLMSIHCLMAMAGQVGLSVSVRTYWRLMFSGYVQKPS